MLNVCVLREAVRMDFVAMFLLEYLESVWCMEMTMMIETKMLKKRVKGVGDHEYLCYANGRGMMVAYMEYSPLHIESGEIGSDIH